MNKKKNSESLGTLLWRHNGHDGVSNHMRLDCLLNRLFRRRSKKISKLRLTGLCEGNSPVTGGFPSQIANNAENVSIWWRHHGRAERVKNTSMGYRSANSLNPPKAIHQINKLKTKAIIYINKYYIRNKHLFCTISNVQTWDQPTHME